MDKLQYLHYFVLFVAFCFGCYLGIKSKHMKDNSDRRFLKWLFITMLIVTVLWQLFEYFIYGEVQPRIVDDIIGVIWIITLYWAFYIGKDAIVDDYDQDLIHADELRDRVWDWAEEAFAKEPDNNKFNQLIDLIDESEVIN